METLVEALFVLAPFFLVGGFAPAMARWCLARGMVAHVTERSAHRAPLPQGGGALVVFVTAPFVLLAVWWFDIPQKVFLTALVLSSLPLAFMGWLDDIRHRPPLMRLLIHAVCVGVGVAFLPPLFDVVPLWAEKAILVLAWVWFVNLYNFMDGLDGLTASETVFLCLGLILFVPTLGPVAAIMAGAMLGFLRVNWHPARLILGDVGSTYLGFIMGGLLLVGLERNTWELVYPLFTLTLVFSADSTYTLFKRVLQGHKPWVPHREFWFHRAARAGYSHVQVVGRALLLNAGLLAIALLGYATNAAAWTVAAGVLLMLWAAWRIVKMEREKTG
jgi:UDP-N-acetylmuramyl pentapeptide phosphotransferase/UDP-N-acetylglucosamine-1-phosphate transferase